MWRCERWFVVWKEWWKAAGSSLSEHLVLFSELCGVSQEAGNAH